MTVGKINENSEEFKRQRRELQLSTCTTLRTQMRYYLMLGRGWYMEKVRKGKVAYNPEIIKRFEPDGDVK
jgi:hypothetical protein